ncbi:MAG: prolipoprotein diacylglyceryl transferase family protein, partial [Saprospiraceae bacterium]
MQTLLTITWNSSPEIISIGPITLRWYGLLFASGFLVGLFIVKKMFVAEKAPEAWLDKAFMHIVLGAVIGARLG